MLERIVIGGRALYVEPKIAAEARARMKELAAKDERVARDLRSSGLLPRQHGSQVAGLIVPATPRIVCKEIDNKAAWVEHKRGSIEDRWQAHLVRHAGELTTSAG